MVGLFMVLGLTFACFVGPYLLAYDEITGQGLIDSPTRDNDRGDDFSGIGEPDRRSSRPQFTISATTRMKTSGTSRTE